MLPDRVSNPRPLTYESGALSIALRGPAIFQPGQQTEIHEQMAKHRSDLIDLKIRLI